VNPTLRRAALALVALAEVLLPFLFDWFGLVTSGDATAYGPETANLAFVLDIAWLILLVWSVVEDLPAIERSRTRFRYFPWFGAVVVGLAALSIAWALSSREGAMSSRAFQMLQAALIHGAIAVSIPSIAVLFSRAVGKPIDASRVPLRRWITVVALVVLVAPPFMKVAKMGPMILLVVASWMKWAQDLPPVESKVGARKWRFRASAFAIGAAIYAAGQLFISRLYVGSSLQSYGDRPVLMLMIALCGWTTFSSLGLMFTVASTGAADVLALTMRRSSSLRARMLTLGLFCAGVALALTRVPIVDALLAFAPILRPEVRQVLELVLLGVMVYVFSVATSKELSRSLEQSVQAISEIRRGNLDVTLDESGRDEVAAVARSVNEMVALLREAEFLERINADLRSRSTQLAQTLEALRTAQADLVRSERMASVATLVKGIAHELNNPINYIAGNVGPLKRYCEFLTRIATELADGRARSADQLRELTRLTERKDLAFVTEDLARLTVDIGEGARRAQLIITDLQSLTSAAQRGIERVDLHRVVRQTISLLQPRVPAGVRLEAELSPVSTLPARAGQLEQVLVNLTDNALRAVGDSGTVRIYVDARGADAIVKVIDDGQGMTPEVKRQAFEPFFTTRLAGEGSGLGLAIVASIVRAHRGAVTLKSEPGKGTEVELRLPLEPDTVTMAELAATM
jgi:signal transduction histidine kinase